jgi:hypothetical protein
VLLSDAMAQPTTRTKGVVRADRDVPAVNRTWRPYLGAGSPEALVIGWKLGILLPCQVIHADLRTAHTSAHRS